MEIKRNDTITIQRTENGWIVRPEWRQNELMSPELWLVFNEMGYASGVDGNVPTLLTFIEKHFRRP